MKGTSRDTQGPPVFEIIEEALLLLKRIGLGAYGLYGAGTFAFLWAGLFFFAHMSRNAHAPSRLSEYSFLLALAFVAMKATHAFFFSRLMEALEGDASGPVPWRVALRTTLAQALLQPLGLFLIPVALLLAIPFPWVCAFFQGAQWIVPGETNREWLSRAYRLTLVWPGQLLFINLFLSIAGLCLFLNIAVALFAVPHLLKSLLGIDSVFTRSQHAYLNTTFFMVVLALSWAALDPVVKAIYALRCFRGGSIRTGRDLRLALRRAGKQAQAGSSLRSTAKTAGLVLLCLLPFSGTASPAPAHAEASERAVESTISPSRMDALLKDEISGSRYGWRMSHPASVDTGGAGFLIRWLEKSVRATVAAIKAVARVVHRFFRWFNSIFGKKDTPSGTDALLSGPSTLPTRILLLILGVTLVGAILLFCLRRFTSRSSALPAAAVAVSETPAPDLASEDVKADDLPEQEWLRLMEQLRLQGDSRLAMRALFLALLSLLARKGWLTFARHKSNRDYQREVALKSRRRPVVAESFRESCLRFDRIWYGQHAVSDEDWEVSRANYARVDADGN